MSSCTALTYDSEGFVALFCGSFMAGMLVAETEDSASDYEQLKEIGVGTASLELNLRYNFGKHVHVGALVGAEAWLGKLTAERADGTELFHSRIFNANLQLGVGINF